MHRPCMIGMDPGPIRHYGFSKTTVYIQSTFHVRKVMQIGIDLKFIQTKKIHIGHACVWFDSSIAPPNAHKDQGGGGPI